MTRSRLSARSRDTIAKIYPLVDDLLTTLDLLQLQCASLEALEETLPRHPFWCCLNTSQEAFELFDLYIIQSSGR